VIGGRVGGGEEGRRGDQGDGRVGSGRMDGRLDFDFIQRTTQKGGDAPTARDDDGSRRARVGDRKLRCARSSSRVRRRERRREDAPRRRRRRRTSALACVLRRRRATPRAALSASRHRRSLLRRETRRRRRRRRRRREGTTPPRRRRLSRASPPSRAAGLARSNERTPARAAESARVESDGVAAVGRACLLTCFPSFKANVFHPPLSFNI